MKRTTKSRSDLSARLRAFRAGAGLSQPQLAERAGLTVGAVRQIEQGRRKRLYGETLLALADALGVKVEDFLR